MYSDLNYKEMSLYATKNADYKLVTYAEKQLHIKADINFFEYDIEKQGVLINEKGIVLFENGVTLQADFSKIIHRIIPNNLNRELVVKASRFKKGDMQPIAIDATAGLGEDAFLLAASGYYVYLYERNPIIALLLYDALRRGRDNPVIEPIVKRMKLQVADSTCVLNQLHDSPDLVMLDPMFPKRSKSGLIKKKFQLLHQLEAPCIDEEKLLDSAISINPQKVIIKRPLKGPFLADYPPDYSIKGKTIRFDCIIYPLQKTFDHKCVQKRGHLNR